MGYDLHISRAEEYYDSAEHPIALDEWLSYAESNSTFRVGGWLGRDEDRQPIYEYTCADESVVSLTWFEGAIEINGHFDGDAYREFGAVAEDLRANLQGDHGERYTAGGVLPPPDRRGAPPHTPLNDAAVVRHRAQGQHLTLEFPCSRRQRMVARR